ncbi:MAG: hypothetical protein ACRC3J_09220 [Culicoidibacterales bacterium]
MFEILKPGMCALVHPEWFDEKGEPIKCWILDSNQNDDHSIAVTRVDVKKHGCTTVDDFRKHKVYQRNDYWYVPREYFLQIVE